MSRHIARSRLAPAALALLVLLLAGPVAGVSTPASAATSTERFGMAAHFMWQSLSATRADLDRMKRAGMTYVRFDVGWRHGEPSRGSFNGPYLGQVEAVVREIKARGMTLTMTVLETPGWANGGRGWNAPPTNMADYARFTGVLAKRLARYTGMRYEIWNEENDPHFWSTGPSAARYTVMLKAAYKAIKANDSDAKVLVGGILFNDIAFLHAIYANGGGHSFDAIAIHPYSLAHSPSDTWSTFFSFRLSVPRFTAEMARHGQHKRIWITEFGWSTDQLSDATRARFLAAAVVIARQWGNVRGIAAYTLHQTQTFAYGLIRSDNSTTASWRSYVAALP